MSLAHVIEAVAAAVAVALFLVFERRANKRGRAVLLRGLAMMSPEQRDAFIDRKFKPHVQAELRTQLREQYQIT